ncbi:MAG: MFS transporter [Candidatus Anstonellales archaeon]
MQKKQESKNLKNSIYDGAAYSAAVGAGESYVAPYAIFRGATSGYLGLLSSFPALLSAIFQLSAPYALNKFKNRKGLVLLAVFLNAFSWLLMLSTVLISSEIALFLLIIFFTSYAATNAFAGTLWSSWIADLVPENIRGYFFGRRNAITQFVSLVSTLFAGVLLGLLQDGTTMMGFSILFFASFIFRMVSLRFLKKIDDPPHSLRIKTENPLRFFKTRNTREAKNVILLSALFLFSATIAGPFFVAYMLKDLGFNYFEYTLVIIASSVARVIAMPYWGEISSRFGNRIVLTLGAFFVSFIPLLWLLSRSVYIITLVEIFGGFVWAAFDLSIFNYLIGSVRREEIPSYMGNYNFFTGIAKFIGPNIGALLIWNFSSTPLFGLIGIPAVILISGIARFIVSLLIMALLKEQRLFLSTKNRPILLNVMFLYPARGLVHNIFVGFSMGRKIVKKGVEIASRKKYSFILLHALR